MTFGCAPENCSTTINSGLSRNRIFLGINDSICLTRSTFIEDLPVVQPHDIGHGDICATSGCDGCRLGIPVSDDERKLNVVGNYVEVKTVPICSSHGLEAIAVGNCKINYPCLVGSICLSCVVNHSNLCCSVHELGPDHVSGSGGICTKNRLAQDIDLTAVSKCLVGKSSSRNEASAFSEIVD